jgi:hypothetical protein
MGRGGMHGHTPHNHNSIQSHGTHRNHNASNINSIAARFGSNTTASNFVKLLFCQYTEVFMRNGGWAIIISCVGSSLAIMSLMSASNNFAAQRLILSQVSFVRVVWISPVHGVMVI